MHHPTDRITYTTAFVTPVVEHWLEQTEGIIFIFKNTYIYIFGFFVGILLINTYIRLRYMIKDHLDTKIAQDSAG